MNTTKLYRLFVVLLCLGAVASNMNAKDDGKNKRNPQGVQKTAGTPVLTYININNISTVLRNNGTADIDAGQANSGLVFPKGSRKTAIYESGAVWGAKIAGDPQVRVGGSAYTSGMQPGKLLGPGVAEDPALSKNRIYRVRTNYRTADLSSEINDEGGTASEIRAHYELDWNEWPVADGAPFKDVDSNGVYNPAIDIPGVPGADQTVWFVANDNNTTNIQNLYGAQPMGIECQYTIWAYAQEGALGNMIFKSYLLINKGNLRLDSMYVCQWSDPDLGNAADDYAGCDTSLSLGYIYNAGTVDATYNPLPPPAAGFDFFQGPRVPSPGSKAIFRGKEIDGYRSLPMTAFFYFINSDPTLADPTRADPKGSTEFYNFMRGRIGLTGQFFQDPQGNPTAYTLTGNPQTGSGWIDGQQFPAGDRRIGLSSGPFTMAPGDTQEIVVAEIAAGAVPGVDRLAAVGLLKFFDKVAQLAYDNFFQLPSPPPAPKVTVTELNKAVLFNWGTDAQAVNATENSDARGFKFQGYNVYQLPSASATITQARKVAVFDVGGDGITRITDQVFDPAVGVVSSKVVQLGTDSGIKRSLTVTGDALNGGNPLINGIRYYFAITSYSYSPDPNAVPNNLENPLAIITVTPHSPNPGVRYQGTPGDTLAIAHTVVGGSSASDGQVVPIVLDPSRATGDQYQVTFATNAATGETKWSVKDVTKNTTALADQTNQSGDDNYLFADGIQVKVVGPSLGMKAWSIPTGTRRFSPVGGALFNLEGFSTGGNPDAPQDLANGTIGAAANFAFGGITTTLLPTGYHNVLLKLAAVDNTNLWDPGTAPADANFSRSYRYVRSATAAPAKPEFAPWITNPGAGYAYQDYIYGVPFSAWDMETNPPTRLAIGHLENNQPGGLVDGRYWPGLTDVDNGAGTGPREFCFIFATPYTATPDPQYTINLANSHTPLMWVMTCARRADVAWVTGDEFMILANHVNSPADVFSFTAPSVTTDKVLAKNDVSNINVFPNPYYGVNTEELNKYQRFVIFNHLPERATIKVFNLAGIQVREIRKNSVSQFERWDLANESGLPVGSGLYIVHIDMPDLGATKILKLAVVQEQQILDRF